MRLLKGLGFLLTPRRVAPPLAPTCGSGGGSGGGRGELEWDLLAPVHESPGGRGEKKIYVAAGEGQEVAEITFKVCSGAELFFFLPY